MPVLLLAVAPLLAACTSTVHGTQYVYDETQASKEAEIVLDEPGAGTNDGDIRGLWAGRTLQGADVRLKVDAASIRITTWCGDVPSTVTVSARVTQSIIEISESHSAERGSRCDTSVWPAIIPRCMPEAQAGCFEVTDTMLVFRGTSLFVSGGDSHLAQFEKVDG